MAIRVLVVDDSSFFRRVVSEIINKDPRLEVIDTAVNGREAVEKSQQLKPDVITMDIEMPVMDGIEAVRQITARHPLPILMFSSLTTEGAKATLDALDAGALDYLPKKFEELTSHRDEAARLLTQKIKAIASRRPVRRITKPSVRPAGVRVIGRDTQVRSRLVPTASLSHIKFVVIGTSTGGPVALQKIFTKLPRQLRCPIVVVQHMPAAFTPAFAQRLNTLCDVQVKEAEDGERLVNGTIYIAPGGKQTMLGGTSGSLKLVVRESEAHLNYKPCVDVTLASIARLLGRETLSIILTGMGADGREGCKLIKAKGATVWAQDEASCVVYGMPMAVATAGLTDEIVSLEDIGRRLAKELA